MQLLKLLKAARVVHAHLVGLTHLSTLVCDQGSEWLGVEAAVAESQAAVHTVSSQLQGLLTDVILMDTREGETPIRPDRNKDLWDDIDKLEVIS